MDDTRVFTADDLFGILVHGTNSLGSHLTSLGLYQSDFAGIEVHLLKMADDARRIRVMMDTAKKQFEQPAAN